jgi:TPR repeat protein
MKQPEEMFDIDKQEIFDVNKLVLSIDTYKKNPRDVKALWALHYYYKNGWCDVIKDPDKTIACLKIAAKHGHAGASYELIRYSSKFNDEDSISLVRLYTNNEHIQKCFDKSDECNDPPLDFGTFFQKNQ